MFPTRPLGVSGKKLGTWVSASGAKAANSPHLLRYCANPCNQEHDRSRRAARHAVNLPHHLQLGGELAQLQELLLTPFYNGRSRST